jgi:CPA1 family monovalent cation:H+ antiporter
MELLDFVIMLLVLAAAFTYINTKYLRFSPTIGLMILSMGLSGALMLLGIPFPGILKWAHDTIKGFNFNDMLMHVMLSGLLFAGALHIDVGLLKQERGPIAALTIFGVLGSTFIVGFALHTLLPFVGIELPLLHALLFGALISPTDPVAVLAMLPSMKVPKSIEIKIAAESLFNDGVGVIVFLSVLQVATKGSDELSAHFIGEILLLDVAGGALMGYALAHLGIILLKQVKSEHEVLEVMITISMVLGGNRLAELLGLSGPLAMVVMGIRMGHEGRKPGSKAVTSDYMLTFWHLVDEMFNAILFMLLGFEMLALAFDFGYLAAGAIAIAVVLLGRFISVLVPIKLYSLRRPFDSRTIAILTWSGLRGALSVGMSLSLPESPYKSLIMVITYCVVVFSILVQGLTMGKIFKPTN